MPAPVKAPATAQSPSRTSGTQVGEFQLPVVQTATAEALYPLSHENVNDAPLAVFAPPLTPFNVVKAEAHGVLTGVHVRLGGVCGLVTEQT